MPDHSGSEIIPVQEKTHMCIEPILDILWWLFFCKMDEWLRFRSL